MKKIKNRHRLFPIIYFLLPVIYFLFPVIQFILQKKRGIIKLIFPKENI